MVVEHMSPVMQIERATAALAQVPDPEIPVVSIFDLGMVYEVDALGPNGIHVALLPTFSGCPALDIIQSMATEALKTAGFEPVEVVFNLRVPYTSSRITAKGREDLKKWGITPPDEASNVLMADSLDFLDAVECPSCGSRSTEMRSPFGPALCRSLHFCFACKNAFEAFKPIC
jgi:ring-1,2-phenylacetyl-CoA epoxidase subunit PaaD